MKKTSGLKGDVRFYLQHIMCSRLVMVLLCLLPNVAFSVLLVSPKSFEEVSAYGTQDDPLVINVGTPDSKDRKCVSSVSWISWKITNIQWTSEGYTYKHLVSYDVKVLVEPNLTLFDRTGVVYVLDYHDDAWRNGSVTITQKGASVDVACTKTVYGIKGGGGNLSVNVAEGVQWTIDTPAWMHTQSENVGSKQLPFVIEANRSSSSRSGLIHCHPMRQCA